MLNQLLWQKCWNSLLVHCVILFFISSVVKEDRPTVTTFTSALLSWNYSFSSVAVLFSCSDFAEHCLSTVSNYGSVFHVHFEVPYVGRPQASRCRPNRTVICVFFTPNGMYPNSSLSSVRRPVRLVPNVMTSVLDEWIFWIQHVIRDVESDFFINVRSSKWRNLHERIFLGVGQSLNEFKMRMIKILWTVEPKYLPE